MWEISRTWIRNYCFSKGKILHEDYSILKYFGLPFIYFLAAVITACQFSNWPRAEFSRPSAYSLLHLEYLACGFESHTRNELLSAFFLVFVLSSARGEGLLRVQLHVKGVIGSVCKWDSETIEWGTLNRIGLPSNKRKTNQGRRGRKKII
jgi:hypothetical protein